MEHGMRWMHVEGGDADKVDMTNTLLAFKPPCENSWNHMFERIFDLE